MTVIEDSDIDYDFDDDLTFFYTEKSTALIYEARLFDGFALIRPAIPAFYLALRKISLTDFVREFEEYAGDSASIRSFLWGDPEAIVEIQH